MIREFLQKRRLRKTFSKYVDSATVDALLSGSATLDLGLKEMPMEFVCVAVRGDTPETISERMGAVCERSFHQSSRVDAMFSGIVLVIYDLRLPDASRASSAFRKAVLEEFSENVKLVHGSGVAHVGNLGAFSSRFAYSFILPGFLEALGALASLPFGNSREWLPPKI